MKLSRGVVESRRCCGGGLKVAGVGRGKGGARLACSTWRRRDQPGGETCGGDGSRAPAGWEEEEDWRD